MRLIHYSETPLTKVVSKPHRESGAGLYKTPGLWVSVEGEDDWLSWCRAEQWRLTSFKYATLVLLANDAKILRLKSSREIDRFTKEYVTFSSGPHRYTRDVDWPRIRSLYQGLIIAPYCWDRRLAEHTSWYYGWDCASGVIWDAKAVASLVAIDPPQIEEA